MLLRMGHVMQLPGALAAAQHRETGRSMEQINVLGIETRYGYRTFELYRGDLSQMDRPVDVLVLSAFADCYVPIRGTLLGSLAENCHLDIAELVKTPAFDFRDSLGVWISREIKGQSFGRVLCAELIGVGLPISEVLANIFVGLLVMEAKGTNVRSVALPVLGAGNQRLSPAEIISNLLPAARDYLERSVTTESILFVELNADRAEACAKAMDQMLGRQRVTIPHDQLLATLTADVADKVHQSTALFSGESALKDHWLHLCDAPEVRLFELGMLARQLVELLVSRLGGGSSAPLYNRIRSLEENGGIAPWMCGYMNVLRHVGNEAAHTSTAPSRRPPVVEQADLALTLLCVHRLLEFWIFHCSNPAPSGES